MDIQVIKHKVDNNEFLLSAHADEAAADENIGIAEIRAAILGDEILEEYPDTGRGESCLVLGFVAGRAIHVVCGWRHAAVLVITVYIPRPPQFDDPRSRRRKT